MKIVAKLLIFIFLISSCHNKDQEPERASGSKILGEYLQVFSRLFKESKYDSARIQLRKTDSLARIHKNNYALSSVWANFGLVDKREGKLEEAVINYEKALEIDYNLRDTSSLILHLRQVGSVFRGQSKFSLAAENLEEAIVLAEIIRDTTTIAQASNSLGNVLTELLDYGKALGYYETAIRSWKGIGDMGNHSIAVHNKGDALRGLGRLREAMATYKKALKLKRDLNRTSSSAYTLTGMGRTYLLMDSVDRAEKVLLDALEIRSKSSNKSSYAETLLILSRVSLAKKQYRKAESQLKEVEQIARDYNKADLLRDAFEDQRALYKAWGKMTRLAEVDEVYDIMTDSLYREEKLKVQEAQSAASLQREQQKTQLAEQGTRLANLELASESQKSQFRLILIVIAMMGILVIAWQLLQIRKRNATLIALNSRIKLITDNAFHSQKNALGLISALLRSKARQSQHAKELEVLKDVEGKIEALGGVAKSLFQRRIEDNTAVAASVKLKSYLEELVDDTFSSVASTAELDISIDDIETTSTEALNIGLITNEAVTNFSKYAESAGADTLLIRVTKEGEKLHLSFTDNGPGFPEDFDFSSSTGFGMQMMANLVEDMDGKIAIKREDDLTLIEVIIPLKA